jgi:Fe-S-cluster containining protein
VTDANAFLERLSAELGRPVPPSEVFVDFDEGRALFPARRAWQEPAHYPAMRVQVDAPSGHPCLFLSQHGECTIHAIRPAVCRNYHCEHLQKVLSML